MPLKYLSGLVSSTRRAFASKKRVLGSNPCQVWWVTGHFINVGWSARLKTIFELNPVTEGKQETLPYLILPYPNGLNPAETTNPYFWGPQLAWVEYFLKLNTMQLVTPTWWRPLLSYGKWCTKLEIGSFIY